MQLTEHRITDSTGEYMRDVWLMPAPTDEPHRLCVFLDAEYYLRDMDCPPVISGLMQNGLISLESNGERRDCSAWERP